MSVIWDGPMPPLEREGRVDLPCGHTVTEEWLMSTAGRIASARRVKPTGGPRPGSGRPAVLRTCPRCGRSLGVVAMRMHRC